MTFPEEAAYWTEGADGDPVLPAPADEPVSVTEEQLADAIAGAPVVETISYRRDVLGEFPPDAEPQRADEPVSVPPPSAEPVHACPPSGSNVMPCCGRTPFEVPFDQRMSTDPALVTCGRARADEQAPVPPPVDALPPLPPKWTRPSATEAHNIASVLGAPQRTLPPDDHWDDRPFVEWQAAAIQQVMYRAVDDAHAAGVAEGRRQRDEETHADVRRSAEAALAAFGPTPESVIVSYTQQVGAYEQRIYDEGIREGRRQATEERTEVEYAVRVDRLHPTRTDEVGDVLTHFGEEKSRMCHEIWDGWTPVRRTVGPWEEFEDDGA